jgi:hypothetical protein
VNYLLFLVYSNPDRAWVIDGCGNSGLLSRSATILAAVRSAEARRADGLVQGVVSPDSSLDDGIPDVAVKATGNSLTFMAKTNKDGRFEMRLPVGRWTLEAIRRGWSFEPDPLGYEDPKDLRITPGCCAQVQFTGAASR